MAYDIIRALRKATLTDIRPLLPKHPAEISEELFDKAQAEWYNWALDRAGKGRVFDNWITAWNAFVASGDSSLSLKRYE